MSSPKGDVILAKKTVLLPKWHRQMDLQRRVNDQVNLQSRCVAVKKERKKVEEGT